MKRGFYFGLFVILALILALSGCNRMTCHACGGSIEEGDAIRAGSRNYCSYDCYWDEAIFGK